MCTSDRSSDGGRLRRVTGTFLLLAAACIVITNIYAVFGHGIRSGAMDYMFLYPLGAGLLHRLLAAVRPGLACARLYRPAFNLYCSGIAALTAGSLLRGILEIAGATSPYQPLFMLFGWAFALSGLVLLAAARR